MRVIYNPNRESKKSSGLWMWRNCCLEICQEDVSFLRCERNFVCGWPLIYIINNIIKILNQQYLISSKKRPALKRKIYILHQDNAPVIVVTFTLFPRFSSLWLLTHLIPQNTISWKTIFFKQRGNNCRRDILHFEKNRYRRWNS